MSAALKARLAAAIDGRSIELPSGAGHDAVTMAGHPDIAILFVRSTGGSHNPGESVTEPDVALAIAAAWAMNRGREKKVAKSRFQVPAQLTPFSVLALLRNIQSNDGLTSDMHRELAGSIQSLERHYFEDTKVPAPDLRSVAENWVSRAR